MLGNPLEIGFESTQKSLKITVFDCILKHKTPKIFPPAAGYPHRDY